MWIALVAAACVLTVARPGEEGWRAPTVSLRSAEERQAGLGALQHAWQTRPDVLSAEHERAERVFLNRLAFYVRGTDGTESGVAARRLWNQCYRDHAQRYRDFLDAP